MGLNILLRFRREQLCAFSIPLPDECRNVLYSQGRAFTTKTGLRISRIPMTWATKSRRILGLTKTSRP